MVIRKIEIEDDLKQRCIDARNELIDDFIEWLKENPDCDSFHDYMEKQGGDRIHELADSWTPIYYNEIDGLYYLYSDELEEAYRSQGLGEGKEDNHKQVAIYCYIYESLYEDVRELEKKINDILEKTEHKKTIEEYIKEIEELKI